MERLDVTSAPALYISIPPVPLTPARGTPRLCSSAFGASALRLVHLLDESRRKELMVFYAEDLAPSGYTAAQLLDGKEPRPEWKAVERVPVRGGCFERGLH